MKNDCAQWKDQLLEAALAGSVPAPLEDHLRQCTACTGELAALRARRERLDSLLPLVAQGAAPSPDFRARVLAAAEAAGESDGASPWRAWVLGAATVAFAAAFVTLFALRSRVEPRVPQAELATAQKLAEWRAPTDAFLKTPGQEILQATPKLGESYLPVPGKTEGED